MISIGAGSSSSSSSSSAGVRMGGAKRRGKPGGAAAAAGSAAAAGPAQTKWRSGTQERIYGRRLLDALRATRSGAPHPQPRPRAVKDAADSALALTARGQSRWSRAILLAGAATCRRRVLVKAGGKIRRHPRPQARAAASRRCSGSGRSRTACACSAGSSPAAGSCRRRTCSRRRPTTSPRSRCRSRPCARSPTRSRPPSSRRIVSRPPGTTKPTWRGERGDD